MNTTDKLGFKLIINEPNTTEREVVVCPRYNGMKLKWNRQNGKVYHTEEVDSNIEFWGIDFKTIYDCQLLTHFVLVVYVRGRGEIGRCRFRKTDCTWDVDNGICGLSLSLWNKYKAIDAASDNEYNLVRLGLTKKTMNFYVYPQNQIYFQDDNIITLFSSAGSPAQPTVEQTHDHDKLTAMHFRSGVISGALKITDSGELSIFKLQLASFTTSVTVSAGRTYTCAQVATEDDFIYYLGYRATNVLNFYGTLPFAMLRYKISTARVVAMSSVVSYDSLYSLTNITVNDTEIATCRIWVSYAGLATRQILEGLTLPADDITYAYNTNMKSRTPVTIDNNDVMSHIGISARVSRTDKGYGMVEGTSLYYNTPDDDHDWMPVRRESWFDDISVWVEGFVVSRVVSNSYRDASSVDDFYSLGDVIKAVLNKIDSSIIFEADVDHSQFLFAGENPMSGQPQGLLYISQKSNILNLGYDYPAWQAPITWARIETLLKNAFGCYWQLEERNGEQHMRIEHLKYFLSGGTYTNNATSGEIDLRSIVNTANRRPYAFHTNRWEWDKDGSGMYSSASRYEYSWMDTQSAIFDGDTIVIPDGERLFEEEKTDERKIDWFSSDLDFLTAVHAECSSDGFVIVMEDYTTPGRVILGGGTNYGGQNYPLSLQYLQPTFLVQCIYAARVTIGEGDEQTTGSRAKMRKAEITFSLPRGEWLTPDMSIRTAVGSGTIDALEYDATSDVWKATVRYDNE